MDASGRRVDKCACNDGFVFFNFFFFNKAQQRQHQAQFKIQQTNQLPARYGKTPAVALTQNGQS